MPRRDSEEEHDALPPPAFTTLTQISRNYGAGHADTDSEGTESESDADVEKEFDESTGKKYISKLLCEYQTSIRSISLILL